MTQRPTLEVVASMVDNLSAPLRQTAQTVNNVTSAMKTALEAVGVGLSLAAVGGFFRSTVEASIASEQSIQRLVQALNNAGQSYVDWKPKIDDVINSLTKTTRFSETDYRTALTNMIAKNQNAGESLKDLAVVADVAAFKHISMAEAADMVGKVTVGILKPLKQFGINATGSADGMEKLRAAVHGYAVGELSTLGGQIELAKTNFEEFKVKVGDIITGSEGAREATGFFANALADLSGWVVKNRASLETFVAQVFSTIKAIGQLLAPVVALCKAMADAVESTVGWTNVWHGLRIAFVTVSAAIGEVAALFKMELGNIEAAIGDLLVKAAPIFDHIGIHFGDMAKGMATNGDKMAHDARASMGQLADNWWTQVQVIATGADEGQKAVTKSYQDGALQRGGIVDSETSAERKKREAAIKQREAAMKAAGDALDKMTQQYVRDFAGDIPTAVDGVNKKIADLQDEVDKLAVASIGASAAEKSASQARIDAAEQAIQAYRVTVPILQSIADLADADATASQEEAAAQKAAGAEYTGRQAALDAINARLAAARQLEADAGTNSQAIAEAKKLILKLVGEQLTAEQKVEDMHVADDVARAAYTAKMAAERQKRISDLLATATAAGNVATQLGLMDQQANAVLQSAVGIAQSFATGNVAGVISGFGGLLGSLFGESPENAARKALIAKNSEALAKLTEINGRLVNLSDTGSQVSAVQSFLTGPGMAALIAKMNSGNPIDSANAGHDFAVLATRAGISRDQLDKIGKDFSIDLGSTMRELGAALPQLTTALADYKPTAFDTSTVRGRLDRDAFQNQLSGGNGPTLGDYQQESAASPFLSQLFNGPDGTSIDLSKPDALAYFLNKVQAAGSQVNQQTNSSLGGISEADITGYLTDMAGLARSAIATQAAQAKAAQAQAVAVAAPVTPSPTPVTAPPAPTPPGVTVAAPVTPSPTPVTAPPAPTPPDVTVAAPPTVAPIIDTTGMTSTLVFPTAASVASTLPTAADWGMKDLGDYLGPKIDTTNKILTDQSMALTDHSKSLADISKGVIVLTMHAANTAAATSDTAAAVSGGALLSTLNQQLQSQTDMTNVNAGAPV